VKFEPELTYALPLTLTEIGPAVTFGGTVAVMLVAFAFVIVAAMPLNRTLSFAVFELKPVPEMATDVPMGVVLGEKPLIVSGSRENSLVL